MFDKYIEYMEVLKKDKSENTISSYKAGIEPFLEYFNVTTCWDIEKITKKEIVDYRSTISGKESTVNARMRTVMAFLNWLVDWEYIEHNPMSRIKALKEPKKVPFVLTDEECMAMVNACENQQEKLMIAFMLTTGVRVGELVNVKVSDISNGYVLIHGKGNKERQIPVRSDLLSMIEKYVAEHNDEYLFSSRKGGGKVSTEAIRLRIKKIAKLAGIDEERVTLVTPHKTRHFFATSLIDNGNDITIVAQALGHSNIQTTLRYAHVRQATMDKAVLDNKKITLQ